MASLATPPVIAVVDAGASCRGAARASVPEDASDANAVVPVVAHDPVWGSRTALVTIVEYADFQCPFCATSEPVVARVRETYGPETVRLVWKNLPLPFHVRARPAAEAAMGVFALAGNDAFWKFYHAAFSGGGLLDNQHLESWANDAGVADLAAWRAGLKSHCWDPAVEADLAEATKLGVNATPTFFANGVESLGMPSFDAFKKIIDDQVKAAQGKVAGGTPRERVYAVLAAENFAKNPTPQNDDEPAEDTKTVFQIPLGRSPARGSATALVTIVEFGDYQCPFCGRAEQTLTTLRQKYGGSLRIVFKDEPLAFHPRAEPAAEAALEVRVEKGDAAFWRMHDDLFAHQENLADQDLVEAAVQQGARAEAVKAAIAGHTHRREIEADVDVADDFGASGTPHFFLNGRRLVGAQPEDKFEAIVDEEIRHARAVLAGGAKPAALYDALVAGGKLPDAPERRELPSLPGDDPARGATEAAARVTVHEWADFQCPFCARVEPTLEELMHSYPGKLRLVWHDYPLPMHPDARTAAQAAREALKQKGRAGFWALHDTLFQHQASLGRADLDGFAMALALNTMAWKAALDGGTHAGEIGADEAAAQAANIDGTPSFLLVPRGSASGYYVAGAESFDKFRKLTDRALGEAE